MENNVKFIAAALLMGQLIFPNVVKAEEGCNQTYQNIMNEIRILGVRRNETKIYPNNEDFILPGEPPSKVMHIELAGHLDPSDKSNQIASNIIASKSLTKSWVARLFYQCMDLRVVRFQHDFHNSEGDGESIMYGKNPQDKIVRKDCARKPSLIKNRYGKVKKEGDSYYCAWVKT